MSTNILDDDQAVSASIGPNRDRTEDPFFRFCDTYSEFDFKVTAVFRKYSPQSLIVTPRDTLNTGVFFFASIEWANPVVLETLRSSLLTSISLGMTNIKALWVELHEAIQRSYNITITRSVMGCVRNNAIDYIASRLGFYKVRGNNEIEFLGMENSQLGAIDLDTYFFIMNESGRSIVNTVDLEDIDELVFLPDLLIFSHRFLHLPIEYRERSNSPVGLLVYGEEVLGPLIKGDGSLMPQGYFDLNFLDTYNFSGYTSEKLGEYLFGFNKLNKAADHKKVSRITRKQKNVRRSVFLSAPELSGVKSMVDHKFIKKIVEHNKEDTNTQYEVFFDNSLFPANSEYDDLSILEIRRHPSR